MLYQLRFTLLARSCWTPKTCTFLNAFRSRVPSSIIGHLDVECLTLRVEIQPSEVFFLGHSITFD